MARAEQWRGRSSAMPKGKPHPQMSSSDDDEDDTTPLYELKGVHLGAPTTVISIVTIAAISGDKFLSSSARARHVRAPISYII